MLDLLTMGARSRAVFYDATEETMVEPWVDDVCSTMTTTQAEETFVGLQTAPRMAQWDGGPREVTEPGENKLTVAVNDYANMVSIRHQEYRRDQFGQFDRHLQELAQAAVTHPNEKISDFVGKLTSYVSYDGQFFFDTDHQIGKSPVQSNDITYQVSTGSAAAPSPEDCSKAVFKAIATMYGLKNSQNRPFHRGTGSFLVMVPSENMDVFLTALSSPLIVDQAANAPVDNTLLRQRGRFNLDIAIVPDLDSLWGGGSGAVKFAVFRTDLPRKPLVITEEFGVVADDTGMNASELALRKRLLFGAQRAYGVGGLHWELGVFVTFSV